MLNTILNEKIELQKFLFDKGFFITTYKKEFNIQEYPFYNNWKVIDVGNYKFYIHYRNKFYYFSKGKTHYFLIGHAYNPFTMEKDENNILKNLSNKTEEKEFQQYIDELTGIFVLGKIYNEELEIQNDCSGLQFCSYCKYNDNIFLSSNSCLIGDLLDLKCDEYVDKLIHFKWYKFMLGNYLPYNLTRYKEVKRIIPNTKLIYKNGCFEISRFYPNKNINYCYEQKDYEKVIDNACLLMKKTMELISKKWERPSISITGGIDSNTTFASANGIYDKYKTFSYVSIPREKIDAEAGEKISKKFNVEHTTINVTNNNDEIENFEIYKKIFIHNDGEIGGAKDGDVRKKITLINSNVCDVEVKSWISETIRAYAYKYFGVKKMPKKIKARTFTSIYKIFLSNRKLVKATDKYFDNYIIETNLKNKIYNYDATDFFVWEMMHGGKCSLNIGVMKSCFDITVPYNNRKLLDLLLSVPLKKRIKDEHHLDMKKKMNKELFDMDIRVINGNDTKIRKIFLHTYFVINNLLPF